MCLYQKHKIESCVEHTYKIFHYEDRKLYSAFENPVNIPYTLKNTCEYPNYFYSFAVLSDAKRIVQEMNPWNTSKLYFDFRPGNLVILQVTALDVEYCGYMRGQTGSYFSYMSKRIHISGAYFEKDNLEAIVESQNILIPRS